MEVLVKRVLGIPLCSYNSLEDTVGVLLGDRIWEEHSGLPGWV